jgi:hypothetical protein
MPVHPPKFDPAALISSLQMDGVPISAIARATDIHRAQPYVSPTTPMVGWPLLPAGCSSYRRA